MCEYVELRATQEQRTQYTSEHLKICVEISVNMQKYVGRCGSVCKYVQNKSSAHEIRVNISRYVQKYV